VGRGPSRAAGTGRAAWRRWCPATAAYATRSPTSCFRAGLLALAENPSSQIEVLNRAERLGVIEDVTSWLEARQLRNHLVHEYITDIDAFAKDLQLTDADIQHDRPPPR
jgi:hypothetical protein